MPSAPNRNQCAVCRRWSSISHLSIYSHAMVPVHECTCIRESRCRVAIIIIIVLFSLNKSASLHAVPFIFPFVISFGGCRLNATDLVYCFFFITPSPPPSSLIYILFPIFVHHTSHAEQPHRISLTQHFLHTFFSFKLFNSTLIYAMYAWNDLCALCAGLFEVCCSDFTRQSDDAWPNVRTMSTARPSNEFYSKIRTHTHMNPHLRHFK